MPEFKITHPDKIFFQKDGFTKGDVIKYYQKVAKYILPYMKDRPESMLRQPDGIKGMKFFQKNLVYDPPKFVKTVTVTSSSDKHKVRYLVCNNKETLDYMANLGCIEINPWNSRVGSLNEPDYIVWDLDPGSKSTMNDLVKITQTIRKILQMAGLKSYCKTSGKSGLHVYAPIKPGYTYDQVKEYAKVIAAIVNQLEPELTVLKMEPKAKRQRIFIDINRNGKGQTCVSAYCLRPADGAPVSTPLSWNEVKAGLDPKKFNIKTIFLRLKKKGDLWKGILKPGISLEKSLTLLEKKLNK